MTRIDVVAGDGRLTWQRRLGPALLPLAWCYAGLQRLRRTAYRVGVLKGSTCARPVISVGALLAGGAGKTPFVAHLAQRLSPRRVAVLSRGYGGSAPEFGRVERDSDVRRSGDEPLLLARSTEAHVWVGRDRAALAARLAPDYDLFVLDDGYQHLRLKRALNICLVPDLAIDAVLPAGLWRERPGALADADFVIGSPRLPDWLPDYYTGPTGVVEFAPGPWQSAAPSGAPPRRVLAFSGIARPERFLQSLSDLELVDIVVFPDHHVYAARDLANLAQRARASGARALVTTAKDAVRLSSRFVADLEFPVFWRDVAAVWQRGEERFARALQHAAGLRDSS